MLELQFQKESISYLKPVVRDVQNIEQTQELRLSDAMPDIGKILSAWGQVILRSKEWLADAINLTGGVMVWVLYVPEEGGTPVCMDTWVPFQLRWDLPRDIPEGTIRTECLTRFIDARSVSPRKIMLRCGVAALAEAYVPECSDLFLPQKMPEDVQLLCLTYPVRLPKEMGEKTFILEEGLTLPPSAPIPEKLIYYRMIPVIQDQKVMANKVIFRGVGIVHLLYVAQDDQLHSWDFEVPFSQFAELEQDHSAEAEADVLVSTTNLEIVLDGEGIMQLKCGLVGQYLIQQMQNLELVEDAYSTTRNLECQLQTLELPLVLECRQETVTTEQNFPVQADVVADTQFLLDFPRQRRMEDRVRLELPGHFQLLFYDTEGKLQSAGSRWEGSLDLLSHPDSCLTVLPAGGELPYAVPGSSSVSVTAPAELRVAATEGQGLPMVTGLVLGEEKVAQEDRPSVILRRAGDNCLWDMAKMSSSTMDAIRKANNIEGEPLPGQMLLIPVS